MKKRIWIWMLAGFDELGQRSWQFHIFNFTVVFLVCFFIAIPAEGLHQSQKANTSFLNSDQDGRFQSQFSTTPDRIWPGGDYWTNPMEDWQVRNGRLESVSSGSDRNVHILTRALGTVFGPFETSVHIGLLEGETYGSAGFRVGIREETIDDYRGNVFFGEGIDAGITVDGHLILADSEAPLDYDTDLENIRLKLAGEPNASTYTLTLTAFDLVEQRSIGRISIDGIEPVKLLGNIALVNNHNQGGSRFWFQNWQIEGPRVVAYPDRAFGPILWSMYTLSDSRSDEGYVMKLQVQLPPLGQEDVNTVVLEVHKTGRWERIGEAEIHKDARNAVFRIPNWSADKDIPYRIVYETQNTEGKTIRDEWTGTIRKDPIDRNEIILASLNCLNSSGFPYEPVVKNVSKIDPDILAFQGDQLYEGNGGYGVIRSNGPEGRFAGRENIERSIVNYLRKYYMFGWPFREVMRDRPTVVMTDDHDVYQGNLWGMGGAAGEADPTDGESWSASGGYYMPARWINMSHRAQTVHNPDFYDPTPIKRDISVWYGDMVYGGVSFAIISDRMFKSSPLRVDSGPGRADLVDDPDWDVEAMDKPGLEFLGKRQMKFLAEWIEDWRAAEIKVLLSQAPFANSNTHHSQGFTRHYADLDAHGWPQTARDEAIDLLRKGAVFHVAGDQHLPSLIKYGTEDFGDAFWGFTAPAVSTGWPRWWIPDRIGLSRYGKSKHGLPNTGNYYDGTGNPMHVYAIGNPTALQGSTRYERAHFKSSGFGVVRLNKDTRQIGVEAYRFLADVNNPRVDNQFPGWSATIQQLENLGGQPVGYLPAVDLPNVERPVVKVRDEISGELVYAVRAPSTPFEPPVFYNRVYTVEVSDPETGRREIHEGQEVISEQAY